MYTGHHHGMIHAFISCAGAVYGFIYADGVEGTTWFHCNWYKLNMFDVQKYLNMVTAGYYAFEILFLLLVSERRKNWKTLLFHHVNSLTGNLLGVYLDGFLGSVS